MQTGRPVHSPLRIPGATHYPEAFGPAAEAAVLEQLEGLRSTSEGGVKVFHCAETATRWMQGCPPALDPLFDWLESDLSMPRPDSVEIRDYPPGTGDAGRRVDSSLYGPAVAVVALVSPVALELSHGPQLKPLLLEPGDVLVLEGAARSQWARGIARRPYDKVVFRADGEEMETVRRYRHVQVTLRRLAR